MKYFIDTEFHEYQKKPLIGKSIDTIELISIGIVSEEVIEKVSNTGDKTLIEDSIYIDHDMFRGNREYYAICKDFDLKAAWNNEWLKDNVLEPIFKELVERDVQYYKDMYKRIPTWSTEANPKYHKFTCTNFKRLVNRYGKTKQQIAEEVYNFCSNEYHKGNGLTFNQRKEYPLYDKFKPEFYGYYSDYDWVVFCWLFGKMIDLPKGFPMYCIDLKQILDEKAEIKAKEWGTIREGINCFDMQNHIKTLPNYPKQTNEHNALANAKWNYDLYKFLKTL